MSDHAVFKSLARRVFMEKIVEEIRRNPLSHSFFMTFKERDTLTVSAYEEVHKEMHLTSWLDGCLKEGVRLVTANGRPFVEQEYYASEMNKTNKVSSKTNSVVSEMNGVSKTLKDLKIEPAAEDDDEQRVHKLCTLFHALQKDVMPLQRAENKGYSFKLKYADTIELKKLFGETNYERAVEKCKLNREFRNKFCTFCPRGNFAEMDKVVDAWIEPESTLGDKLRNITEEHLKKQVESFKSEMQKGCIKEAERGKNFFILKYAKDFVFHLSNDCVAAIVKDAGMKLSIYHEGGFKNYKIYWLDEKQYAEMMLRLI